MKIGDRIFQLWRMRIAAPWIPKMSRVLDVGCHQGEFLMWLGDKISPSVGIDPLYHGQYTSTKHQFFSKFFPEDLPFNDQSFDLVTLLATIEHIRDKTTIARESARLLHKGGRVIITVPSPAVDKILAVLITIHLLDGMSVNEHHGFIPDELPGIFVSQGFQLIYKQKFQFWLNNLFVFEKL